MLSNNSSLNHYIKTNLHLAEIRENNFTLTSAKYLIHSYILNQSVCMLVVVIALPNQDYIKGTNRPCQAICIMRFSCTQAQNFQQAGVMLSRQS